MITKNAEYEDFFVCFSKGALSLYCEIITKKYHAVNMQNQWQSSKSLGGFDLRGFCFNTWTWIKLWLNDELINILKIHFSCSDFAEQHWGWTEEQQTATSAGWNPKLCFPQTHKIS